ncbi:adenylate kinase [mine drainage metagenome]|uniref:Adenylate kinase n=1 Tax=mine drainage metagenome TaxID=410659 RepID=A0A1J5S2X1_9ZZZZ
MKDCASGFSFGGFPCTIPRAEAMKQAEVQIDYLIEIDVADSEIVCRVHPAPDTTVMSCSIHPRLREKTM